jgi:hypothetical protein
VVQLSTKKVDFRAKKVKIWAKFEWVWSENFLSGRNLPVNETVLFPPLEQAKKMNLYCNNKGSGVEWRVLKIGSLFTVLSFIALNCSWLQSIAIALQSIAIESGYRQHATLNVTVLYSKNSNTGGTDQIAYHQYQARGTRYQVLYRYSRYYHLCGSTHLHMY